MIKVFITDLAAYNEGNLVGKWVELPMEEEELETVIQEILQEGHCGEVLCYHEEWFITDYEAPFRVGEYEDIYRLNEWAERLEDCREDCRQEDYEDVIQAIFDYAGSIEEGFGILEDGRYRVFYDCKGMPDVAWEVVNEQGLLNNVPENIARYFDYEAYGQYLETCATFIYFQGFRYLEIW